MGRKAKDKEHNETNRLMTKHPEPESLNNIVKAARALVEYHDQGDGTLVGWCPAVVLVRINPKLQKVVHLFAHTETPPVPGVAKPTLIQTPDLTPEQERRLKDATEKKVAKQMRVVEGRGNRRMR